MFDSGVPATNGNMDKTRNAVQKSQSEKIELQESQNWTETHLPYRKAIAVLKHDFCLKGSVIVLLVEVIFQIHSRIMQKITL